MVELEKCVFYHIPKTGGSWVTTVLQSICKPVFVVKGHAGTDKYPKKDKKAFCFVRHPISWYLSTYFYGTGSDWMPNDFRNEKFDRFAELMCVNYPGWISSQVKIFCKDMDFIGRQENLIYDLLYVLETCHEEYLGGKIKYFANENVNNYAVSIDKSTQRLIQTSESYLMDVFYSYTRNDCFCPKIVLNDGTW